MGCGCNQFASGGSDLAAPADAALDATVDAGPVDAGRDGAVDLASAGDLWINCGSLGAGFAPCNLGQGQVCCLEIGGGVEGCRAVCPDGFDTIACDGDEDCGGGSCCGSFSQGHVAASCVPICQPPASHVCHTQADCGGGAKCCTANGFPDVLFCQASPSPMEKCF